jgi:hypothetical protein
MSRLDDELKLMFQRQEPSADFSERVLARIQAKPQPRESLWQRLMAFFQPNAMRWAVATAAILLVAIIGFTQYQRLYESAHDTPLADGGQAAPTDNQVVTAPPNSPGKTGDKEAHNPQVDKRLGDHGQKETIVVRQRRIRPQPAQRLKYVKRPVDKNEAIAAGTQKSEGELAKEQLLKALSIASATVNEAKKLAIGGD